MYSIWWNCDGKSHEKYSNVSVKSLVKSSREKRTQKNFKLLNSHCDSPSQQLQYLVNTVFTRTQQVECIFLSSVFNKTVFFLLLLGTYKKRLVNNILIWYAMFWLNFYFLIYISCSTWISFCVFSNTRSMQVKY